MTKVISTDIIISVWGLHLLELSLSFLLSEYENFTFNLFVPNAPFLYPFKTSENLAKTLLEKVCIGNK